MSGLKDYVRRVLCKFGFIPHRFNFDQKLTVPKDTWCVRCGMSWAQYFKDAF